MKAVVYDKSNPDLLVLTEAEKPVPNENEVLIRICSVSVNAADYRSMKLGIIPKRKIFGSDIAGVVEAAGKNAGKFKVGDQVLGDMAACGFGGFAEYVAAPETALVRKPAGISFETAAAVPMAAVTALQALNPIRKATPGRKVLICGAGGGVGTFSVQLAKNFGAKVTAVCSDTNAAAVLSLGADHVIDYKKEDFFKTGERYDLILAINGNYALSSYKRALSPNGACVMVGGALPQIFKTMLFGAFMSAGNKKMKLLMAKPNIEDLGLIIGLVEEGRVKPVIDRCYQLSETPEAVRYLSAGHARGKVVINIAGA